jgi:secondary thiamine-phosphate synthase enzyme
MQIHLDHILLTTRGNTDILDITEQVSEKIQSRKIATGLVTLFCPSSTSGLTTIEYEPGVIKDLKAIIDEIVPEDYDYQHEKAWHDGNGHSHIRSALLKPSISVPINDGRMTLGTWQQIVYIDFDNRSRKREIIVQIMGE